MENQNEKLAFDALERVTEKAGDSMFDALENVARVTLRANPGISRLVSAQGLNFVEIDGERLAVTDWPESLAIWENALAVYDGATPKTPVGIYLSQRDALEPEPDGFPAFIADMGLEIDARPVVARPVIGKPDQWQKESFHFQVTIHRVPAGFKPDRAPEIVWSGFYTVGSGHALTWARDGFKTRSGKADYTARAAWRQMHKKPDYAGRGLTVADADKLETVRARFHAVAPLDLADILESLQMDSSD